MPQNSAGASKLTSSHRPEKYSNSYARWDAFAAALGGDAVDSEPARPKWAPPTEEPKAVADPSAPYDPTRVAAMRELLDEIDAGRRPALLAAIEWLERAAEAIKHGAAPDDADCPFNPGDEAWFWFVLLANKPHITLHGPYRPLCARHRSPREQAVLEGLCCARCHAAAGCWHQTPLKRCAACRRVSYCGRNCQREDFDAHRGDCRRFAEEQANEDARVAAQRLDGVLPPKGDRPALRARHSLDGYGSSVLALYENDGPDEVSTRRLFSFLPSFPRRRRRLSLDLERDYGADARRRAAGGAQAGRGAVQRRSPRGRRPRPRRREPRHAARPAAGDDAGAVLRPRPFPGHGADARARAGARPSGASRSRSRTSRPTTPRARPGPTTRSSRRRPSPTSRRRERPGLSLFRCESV